MEHRASTGRKVCWHSKMSGTSQGPIICSVAEILAMLQNNDDHEFAGQLVKELKVKTTMQWCSSKTNGQDVEWAEAKVEWKLNGKFRVDWYLPPGSFTC